MNHLLEDDEDLMPERDREVTLSTGAILGMFFGLVLICGFFFAFGYNLGHKANSPVTLSTNDGTELTANFNAFKPAAGSPAAASTAAPADNKPNPATTSAPQPAPASATPVPAAAQPVPAPVQTPAAPARTPAPQPPPQVAATGTAPAGSFYVQVAAVSHQEDAQLLLGALRARGYTVAARTSPQDSLIHIQVGPFNNKKDAEAMRQRLLVDGYNAILK